MKKFIFASYIWLLAVAGVLAVQFVGSIFIVSLPPYCHTVAQYVIMAIVQVVNVAIVFGFYKKNKFVSSYSYKKPSAINLVKSIAIGLFTFVAMFLISQYVFVFLGNLGAKSSSIDISGWYILPAIIVTVILAPIGEELIFRSSLVYGFDNGKPIVAVLLSSLAFTLMHMSPMQTFYQFALGVALAVLIMRSKNVICSIVAHATSNLAVIILSLVSLPPIPLFNPLTIVLAVVILVFCLLLVAFILKSISPSSENVEIIKDSVVKTEDKTMGVVAISLSIVICLIMWILAFI